MEHWLLVSKSAFYTTYVNSVTREVKHVPYLTVWKPSTVKSL